MSKHDPSSDWPTLLQDVNADLSDALDHLAAGRIAEAVTAIKASADAVREAIDDHEEFEKEA